MAVSASELGDRTALLEFEIGCFRLALAGLATAHLWVDETTGKDFKVLALPEGIPINIDIEQSLISHECDDLGKDPSEVVYGGTLDTSGILRQIMDRQEAIKLERGPAALGAYYYGPSDLVAL